MEVVVVMEFVQCHCCRIVEHPVGAAFPVRQARPVSMFCNEI